MNPTKFKLNGYLSISILVAIIFYLPILNARYVDLIYFFTILLFIPRLRTSRNEMLALCFILLNTAILTVSGYLHGGDIPYYSFFILRFAWLYILFLKVLDIDKKKFGTVLFFFLLINTTSVFLDYLHIYSLEPFFAAIKSSQLTLEYRASGLFSGYYSATIIISVSTIYLYYTKRYALFAISLLPAFIAMFCSGRSGFIVFTVFLVHEFIFAKKKMIKFALFAFAAFIIFLLFQYVYPLLPVYSTETFILFAQVKDILLFHFDNTSTGTLFTKQYYLHDSTVDYFFGNNIKPFTEGGDKSDSGYIQLLFGLGIIPAIGYLIPLLILFLKRFHHPLIRFMFFVTFVLSIKGSLFYSYVYLDLMFVFFALNETKQYKLANEQVQLPKSQSNHNLSKYQLQHYRKHKPSLRTP